MGTYAESLLADGEVIVMRQRQHWLSLLSAVRTAIALWIIAVVLVALLAFLKNTDDLVKNVVGGITTIAVVVGVVVFFWNWWHWQTEEYLVTNRRLLKVSGIINKESGDSSLEKINDAVLQQSMFGRIFDYGDLEIMTAAEIAVDHYQMLNHAKAFKIAMLNAKHTLEHEMTFGAIPTPPIRSGDPYPGGAATALYPPQGAQGAPYPPQGAQGTYPPQGAPYPPQGAGPMPPSGGAYPAGGAGSMPPAGAYPPGGTAQPVPPPAAQPWSPPTPPPASSSGSPAPTADEVTAMLSQLADLRDRGAITAADYDAKKAELLSRL